MEKARIKNLDTFRAIAAILVMIGHIELFRKDNLGNNLFDYIPSGHTAVMIFFVISGFLITFLLTKEKNRYGSIALKNFYLRRVLRILPLYYLVVFISFFLFTDTPDFKAIAFAVGLLPNISHALECGWDTSPQIWAIGVENMFYLIFPLIMLVIPNKRIISALGILIVGLAILPHLVDYVNIRTLNNSQIAQFNQKFFYGNKFDSLLIGCFIGFAYAQNHTMLKVLYNKWLFIICVLLTVILWGGNFETKHFNDELMSVLFAIVILNVCTNPDINIRFENRFSQFLGKISYGIYMYHWIVLLFAFRLLPLTDSVISMVILYGFTLIVTIGVAWLSYETYEKFFLNLKKRFER